MDVHVPQDVKRTAFLSCGSSQSAWRPVCENQPEEKAQFGLCRHKGETTAVICPATARVIWLLRMRRCLASLAGTSQRAILLSSGQNLSIHRHEFSSSAAQLHLGEASDAVPIQQRPSCTTRGPARARGCLLLHKVCDEVSLHDVSPQSTCLPLLGQQWGRCSPALSILAGRSPPRALP